MLFKIENYRKVIFTAIIIIVPGIIFSTTRKPQGSPGIVFIAIGGLLFIAGMYKKKQEEKRL